MSPQSVTGGPLLLRRDVYLQAPMGAAGKLSSAQDHHVHWVRPPFSASLAALLWRAAALLMPVGHL